MTSTTPSDNSGTLEQVQALYLSHHAWLLNWLRRKLGCSATAADLSQDTFVRILQKKAPPQPDRPRAYLGTLARGLLLNHWRREALEKAYLDFLAAQPEPLAPSSEQQRLAVEALTQLATTLDGMSRRDKQIFLLARIDGLKYQQIADQLGISLNMVQKAMGRVMRQCYHTLYD